MATLATVCLVLPTVTESAPGPEFTPTQLAFAAGASLALYLAFVVTQTVRHRDFFLPVSRKGVTLTEDDLTAGDVTVAVSHSSVNFKDGLALTNRAPIIRHYPLNPGVDFAGTVMTSTHPDWQPGDQVVLNGWGHGEQYDGGFSEVARVRGDWLVAVPPG